jgi:hypothetical protein
MKAWRTNSEWQATSGTYGAVVKRWEEVKLRECGYYAKLFNENSGEVARV